MHSKKKEEAIASKMTQNDSIKTVLLNISLNQNVLFFILCVLKKCIY